MKFAIIQCSSKFIHFAPVATNGIKCIDLSGAQSFLPTDASDFEIGSTLKGCLEKSRLISPNEMKAVLESSQAREKEWARETAERFGYKSERSLFKDISMCEVKESKTAIRIMPFNHIKLKQWTADGMKEDDGVSVANHSDISNIGHSVRIVLTHCKSAL